MNLINKAEEQIFERWKIAGDEKKGFWFIHKFSGDDNSYYLHDHPWDFWSFILKGTYFEDTQDGVRIASAGDFRKNKASHLHKVRLWQKKPCWSLVHTGPTIRDWGYSTPDGWVSNKDFSRPGKEYKINV